MATSETRREAILKQAVEVFADQGFRGADVQVIADRAGVGKGTVYRYFGNKEDLFWETCRHVMGLLDKAINTAGARHTDPIESLRAKCTGYIEFFVENPQHLEVFVQSRAEFRGSIPESHREHQDAMINRAVSDFDSAMQLGRIRQMESRNLILVLGSILYGCAVEGCFTKLHGLSQSDTAQLALDIFFDGLEVK